MTDNRAFFSASAAAGVAMLTLATAAEAVAETLSVVSDRDNFVELVNGKELRRFGITLNVTPDGQIIGRAFGTPVSGAWEWENGYFCRDLFWGQQDLGFNCQLVQIDGARMRFTSDQGTGPYADLTLR